MLQVRPVRPVHLQRRAQRLAAARPSRRRRVTLADALRLLALPRVVGAAPDGAEVLAARGPLRAVRQEGRRLPLAGVEEKLFTVSLDEALALLAAPKTRQRRAAAPPLREMGVDPLTEKPMVIKDGRFGPYVTDGESNASLRRGQTVEAMTIEQASEMLAEKRPKGRDAAQEGKGGREDAGEEGGGGWRRPGRASEEGHREEDRGQEDHREEGDRGRQEGHRQEGHTQEGHGARGVIPASDAW